MLRVHNAEIVDSRERILETILTRLEGRDHLWEMRELTQPSPSPRKRGEGEGWRTRRWCMIW
jgi:hypothetical protein